MAAEIHPVLLDQLYHWADYSEQAGNVRIETVSAETLIVQQDDRNTRIGLNLESLTEFLEEDESSDEDNLTYGPGWPD